MIQVDTFFDTGRQSQPGTHPVAVAPPPPAINKPACLGLFANPTHRRTRLESIAVMDHQDQRSKACCCPYVEESGTFERRPVIPPACGLSRHVLESAQVPFDSFKIAHLILCNATLRCRSRETVTRLNSFEATGLGVASHPGQSPATGTS